MVKKLFIKINMKKINAKFKRLNFCFFFLNLIKMKNDFSFNVVAIFIALFYETLNKAF